MSTRRSLTGKERLRIFTLHGGVCHFCNGRINGAREAWDISHEIPLELGGADDDTNRKPAHRKCHRHHTSIVDQPDIAKAHRRELKYLGAKPKRPWGSRPFPSRRPKRNEERII